MKTIPAVLLIAAMATAHVLHAQSNSHPWNVVDVAGGRSTSAGRVLQSSIGQPVIGVSDSGGVHLEAGYMPGARLLAGVSTHFFALSEAGWNMISVPLLVGDYRKTILYPTAISVAFAYAARTFVVRDTLTCGVGYWLKFGGGDSLSFPGTATIEDTIDVEAGWNLVGTLGYPAPVAAVSPIPPVNIIGSFHGFSMAGGYAEADTLEAGRSYWVKVSQAGRLLLRSSLVFAQSSFVSREPAELQKGKSLRYTERETEALTVKDAQGSRRELRFSSKPLDLDLEALELPPLPPAGVLDVRFASQRSMEAPTKGSGGGEFPIQIAGATYPITFTWNDICQGQDVELVLTYADRAPDHRPLRGNGSTTISNERLLGLVLRLKTDEQSEVPVEFALHQNYPNPFNPVTVISYDLPAPSNVSLKVYDLLGKEVMNLVDGIQDEGYKSVEFDAGGVASGVYFYRFQAGSFVQTKRMLLLK